MLTRSCSPQPLIVWILVNRCCCVEVVISLISPCPNLSLGLILSQMVQLPKYKSVGWVSDAICLVWLELNLGSSGQHALYQGECLMFLGFLAQSPYHTRSLGFEFEDVYLDGLWASPCADSGRCEGRLGRERGLPRCLGDPNSPQ